MEEKDRLYEVPRQENGDHASKGCDCAYCKEVRNRYHPTFASIAAEVAALVEEKNAAYGNAVEWTEKALVDLYPDGVPVAAYKNALLIVRVLDKLKRIATNKDAFGESPWRDVNGYSLIGIKRSQK